MRPILQFLPLGALLERIPGEYMPIPPTLGVLPFQKRPGYLSFYKFPIFCARMSAAPSCLWLRRPPEEEGTKK